MRRLFFAVPVLAWLVAGCDEPFTPKAPFKPQPVVTCIVAGTNKGFTATATVGTTYDVNGLDPLANITDPFDTSAVVVVTMNGEPVTLKLSKVKRTDTTRYKTPSYSFTASGQLPYHSASPLLLSIKMKDGKKVSASTPVPVARPVSTSYEFAAGVMVPPSTSTWTFDWDNGQRDDHLYFPKLLLAYQIINGSSIASKTVEIPLKYVQKDGKNVPLYPTYTRALALDYDFAAIGTALTSISEGDTAKSHYKIGLLTFNLVEYDINLSNYYATAHGYLDQYSIRVDESTYSNLSGGIGIFGSSFTNQLTFEMNARFIKSFGYQL